MGSKLSIRALSSSYLHPANQRLGSNSELEALLTHMGTLSCCKSRLCQGSKCTPDTLVSHMTSPGSWGPPGRPHLALWDWKVLVTDLQAEGMLSGCLVVRQSVAIRLSREASILQLMQPWETVIRGNEWERLRAEIFLSSRPMSCIGFFPPCGCDSFLVLPLSGLLPSSSRCNLRAKRLTAMGKHVPARGPPDQPLEPSVAGTRPEQA